MGAGEVAWHLPPNPHMLDFYMGCGMAANQMLSCLLKMGGICYMSDVRL